jgi:hypothetical protein
LPKELGIGALPPFVRLESVRGIAPFPVITRRMAIGSASGSPFSITTKTTSIAGGRHNSIRLGFYGVNEISGGKRHLRVLKRSKLAKVIATCPLATSKAGSILAIG